MYEYMDTEPEALLLFESVVSQSSGRTIEKELREQMKRLNELEFKLMEAELNFLRNKKRFTFFPFPFSYHFHI